MTAKMNYAPAMKLFHWLIALIVLSMLSVSFFLEDLPESMQGFAFMIHKSFGLTVLALVIIQLVLVHIIGRPALPRSVPGWQKFIARLVQYSLYLLLLAMPLLGWSMSMAANRIPVYFGLVALKLPFIQPDKNLAHTLAQWHNNLAIVLLVLALVHILAALWHYYYEKDTVLQSMLPGHQNLE